MVNEHGIQSVLPGWQGGCSRVGWGSVSTARTGVCRLQPVKGDSVVTAIDVDDKVLVFPLEDLVGPIVWLLERLPSGVMSDENVCACGE